MALRYGMNITQSDMKRVLEENDKLQSGVRSWRQLFGNASLGYEAQSSALRTDYSSAIAEAYKSNLAQQNTIMGAGLSAGVTREAIGASRRDLQNAYDTYIRNYASNASALEESYTSEVNTINQALAERATNFANLYSSAYKYLAEELYGSSFVDAAGKNVDVLADQGFDWVYAKDALGNPTTDLMSWNELSSILFTDGVLNEKGQEFYDRIFNTISQGWQTQDGARTRTFDEWLSEQEDKFDSSTDYPGAAKTGKELRDWWVNQDDFNYTFARSNKGTAQQMIGLESTANSLKNLSDFADRYSALKQSSKPVKDAVNTAIEKSEAAKYAMPMAQGGVLFSLGADAEQAEKDVVAAWTSYRDAFFKEVNEVDTIFKAQFGKEEYEAFRKANDALYKERDTLLKEVHSAKLEDYEAYISKFETLYKNLLEAFSIYMYTRKPSGF